MRSSTRIATVAGLVAALWVSLARGTACADPPQSGPRYTIATWTGRDGLPSSYVLSLAQDRDGYLWVGTTAGLVRFDGQRFASWPLEGAFPSPNPVTHAVYAGRDGALWVAFGGPSRIVRARGAHVTAYTPRDGLPEGSMRAIVETRDGSVWAGGTGGLARLRGDRWERITGQFGTPEPGVQTLFEGADGTLWVGTTRGVYAGLSSGNRFTLQTTGLPGAARVGGADGTVAAAADGRVALRDAGADRFDVEPLAPTPIPGPFPVLVDSHRQVWVGSNGDGLFRLSRDGRAPLHLTERDGLSGNLVRALLEDRDGNVWVATQAGLTRITEATITSLPTHDGATSENISTLAALPDGSVWVEVADGLVEFTHGTRMLHAREAGLVLTDITALHASAAGELWIATGEGAVLRRRHHTFERVEWPRSDATSSISMITSSNRGDVWLFDGRRFLVVGADGRALPPVEVPEAMLRSPMKFAVTDASDRVWIGIDGGQVGVYEGGAFRLYGEADGVPAGSLSGMHQDGRGRVWIATDNGLSTFEAGRFVTLTTASGLPRDRVFWVLEDRQGHVWLGVGSGILRLDHDELDQALTRRDHRLRSLLFDASDGLRGTPVQRGVPNAARALDGTIWFITSTGLASIDPARLVGPRRPPIPRIEEVRVDGQRVDATNGLHVPPQASSLQISFAALDLTAPSKIRFRHQLDGVDADWVEDGANRQAAYARLAPGAYRFHVAASRGDGAWNDLPAAWMITMLPTWYQTRTFYAVSVLALGVAVWGAWQLRVRQIRSQFTVVLAERARVGREIHDTLLQSLVGMALQLDNLGTQVDTLASADADSAPGAVKEEIFRMRRQVEHYIGEAQQSIWELRTPRLESGDLGVALRERAERIAGGSGVACAFSASGLPRRLLAHVEQQVLRIAQEAVVNAVRHAHATEVRVALDWDDRAVHVRITDNGRGFDPDAATRSGENHWGISIMRERAEQIGGRFSVSSSPDRGTSIDIVAPVATEG